MSLSFTLIFISLSLSLSLSVHLYTSISLFLKKKTPPHALGYLLNLFYCALGCHDCTASLGDLLLGLLPTSDEPENECRAL